ncbi:MULTISPECIES: hypothetical protein [unclassified Streptomyces]|uniref:hypothetical protein n=1 Tax=unclassified Streptomyces TaxID=2593676 RepID=UPI0035DE0B6F
MPADAAGGLKTAKFRQDSHYLSLIRERIHKPIRSHNEGINGRFKSAEMDIGNPLHRRAPGQVAQTILIAIMAVIGNLDIPETWFYERTGSRLVEADYESSPGPAPIPASIRHRPTSPNQVLVGPRNSRTSRSPTPGHRGPSSCPHDGRTPLGQAASPRSPPATTPDRH